MQQKLYFKNSKGDKLCGVLSVPKNHDGRIVIMAHGFASSKDSKTYTTLEGSINELGIATFRFDFWARGESEGNFAEVTISGGVDDVLQAIEFVKEKGFSRIGIFGNSYGGISSVLAASKSIELEFLILSSAVADYVDQKNYTLTKDQLAEWKEKGFRMHSDSKDHSDRLNYTMLEDAKNNIAYDIADKVKIPVLLIHGDKDEDVPVQHSKKMHKLLPNSKLELVKGANHGYTSKLEHFQKRLDFTIAFIKRHFA